MDPVTHPPLAPWQLARYDQIDAHVRELMGGAAAFRRDDEPAEDLPRDPFSGSPPGGS